MKVNGHNEQEHLLIVLQVMGREVVAQDLDAKKQVARSESEASQVYTVSSRAVRAV